MKYIDADKLIAEIKGIIAAVQKTNTPDALGTMEQCMAAAEIEALNLVLDAIKGLQQEQPEVDLAEEITRFFSKNPIPYEHITDWPLLKNTAIHFYELGINARKEGQK